MARVLVANVAGDSLEAARLALREAGHTVEVVSSGREVLSSLASQSADLAVIDVHLPDVSGVDVCRAVVAGHPGMLVLLLTDEGALDTAVAAIRAGAHDYLMRPIARSVFELAVERALNHGALRGEIRSMTLEDPFALAALPTLREVERRYIVRVLALVANNKTLASRVLGIDRKTLYRKLGPEEDAEP